MSAFIAWPGQSGRESFRFDRLLIAALVGGLVTVASHAAEPKSLKIPAGDDWKIEIIPGPAIGMSSVPNMVRAVRLAQAAKAETLADKIPPLPAPDPELGVVPANAEAPVKLGNDRIIEIVPDAVPVINMASYIEVYNSIPFRRSEYRANPSYRHDATIELMLGQIRPATVTNVNVGSATCCSPQTAMFDKWFSPWGTNAFDYRYSRYRP